MIQERFMDVWILIFFLRKNVSIEKNPQKFVFIGERWKKQRLRKQQLKAEFATIIEEQASLKPRYIFIYDSTYFYPLPIRKIFKYIYLFPSLLFWFNLRNDFSCSDLIINIQYLFSHIYSPMTVLVPLHLQPVPDPHQTEECPVIFSEINAFNAISLIFKSKHFYFLLLIINKILKYCIFIMILT